jgi:CDP-glycerol glycerophosphotransferase (TagB/SpsB family)
MDCYVLWDIFDKKIRSGELRLQGNVDANPFPGHKGKAVANMISSAWSPLKKRFNEEPQANIIGLSEPIEERLKKNKPGVFIFILSMLHQIR